jgi:hypothetical protein
LITKKLNAPFVAQLKPSKKLQRLVIVIYLLAFATSFANALPMYLKLILVLVIGLNFKRSFPILKQERHKIKYTEKLGWQISGSGEFESIEISKSTVITTTFIFLHIHNKSAILIANDALNENDYRELTVRLKITAHKLK